MAIRLSVGRFKPRFKMPKWGLRGSLFAAFAVIAGMGLVIAGGGGFVFRHLGSTMMDLSGRDIPRLSASLQLASQSATLAAQGPGLLASPSDDALKERTKNVKDIQQLAMAKLGEIIELGADQQTANALRDTAKSIDEATQSLVSAARERLDTGALHDKQYEALRKAQLSFVGAAGPAMLDAQTRLNAILGAAEVSADDATEAARTVSQVSTVSANGNLMAADMMAALSANSSDTLEAIEKEFKTTRDRVKSNLEDLPNIPSMDAVRDAVQKLFAFGEGKTGVFKIRQKELELHRLRPDHFGRDPQAQCRPRHQRAGARRRRAERDQRVDLPGAPGDLARHHRNAGPGRAHSDRLGAVRLALCRPQHPAPHP